MRRRPLPRLAPGYSFPVQTALLETSPDEGGHPGAVIVFPPGHPGSEEFHVYARRAAEGYLAACKDSANEEDAVTALAREGFRSCDSDDVADGHRCFEKFVHGQRGGGPLMCVNPRDLTVGMRQEGSSDVCAMTEWLQSQNVVPVQGILDGPGQPPQFKECVRSGGHFACVAWEIHWGAESSCRFVREEDHESTPMQVGVVVQGERSIHINNGDTQDEYWWPQEREGVCVLATPHHFYHGSGFPARTHKDPVVLMQFRWLLPFSEKPPPFSEGDIREAIPLGGSNIREFRIGPGEQRRPPPEVDYATVEHIGESVDPVVAQFCNDHYIILGQLHGGAKPDELERMLDESGLGAADRSLVREAIDDAFVYPTRSAWARPGAVPKAPPLLSPPQKKRKLRD
jgi:hypothetical protein